MPFHVAMLLADSAQAVENKLYVLGGGWSITGPGTPFAIALHLKVPWDRANMRHELRLELLTSDGEPVALQSETDAPAEPLVILSEFEVGRPPGLTPGTPIDLSLAVQFGPLPLEPGSRYEWRLFIGGETEQDWYLAFSTRPGPPGP
jgi:hypothetical protein